MAKSRAKNAAIFRRVRVRFMAGTRRARGGARDARSRLRDWRRRSAAHRPRGESKAVTRPASSTSTRSAISATSLKVCDAKSSVVPCWRTKIVFQQAAEIRGCERVKAACGFIEQQHRGFMKQRARQAHAMGHAGGKSAYLAIEVSGDAHAFGGERDARASFRARHVIHRREESEIFPGAQTSVETFIAAGMVAKLAPRAGGLAFDVAIGDCSAAMTWEESTWRECGGAWTFPRHSARQLLQPHPAAPKRKFQPEPARWGARWVAAARASRNVRAENIFQALPRK